MEDERLSDENGHCPFCGQTLDEQAAEYLASKAAFEALVRWRTQARVDEVKRAYEADATKEIEKATRQQVTAAAEFNRRLRDP